MKQTSKPRVSAQSAREAMPNGSGMDIVTGAIKSQLIVIISGFILLLCFCGIAYSMDDPDSVTKPLSLCALFLSALCGGFSAVRFSYDGILSGLCSGAFTALLIFMLSVIPVSKSGMEFSELLIMYLGIIAASTAGAFIGKRRKDNSRSKIKSQIAKKRKN